MTAREDPKLPTTQDLEVHLMKRGPEAKISIGILKRLREIHNNQTERGQEAIWRRIKMAV